MSEARFHTLWAGEGERGYVVAVNPAHVAMVACGVPLEGGGSHYGPEIPPEEKVVQLRLGSGELIQFPDTEHNRKQVWDMLAGGR